MRRIAVSSAVFIIAVVILALGRLAGTVIRAPQITYSGTGGTLLAYDLRIGRSRALVYGLEQLPVAWSWSPNGASLAYVLLDAQGDYQLYIWSPLTRASVRVARGLPFGSPPRWSPDGREIAVVSARQDICLYPVDGGAPRCMNVQPAGQPVWSPDGKSIAFLPRLPQGGLSRVDVASGQVTALLTGAPDLNHPRWSPDGTLIAFSNTSALGSPRHLYLIPADGGEVTALTGGDSAQDQPAWSLDGTRIAYIENPAQARVQGDVAVVDIRTGEITAVTTHPLNDADPHWSPDGEWLAFVSDRPDSRPRLYTVAADGLDTVEPLATAGLDMGLYAYAWRP